MKKWISFGVSLVLLGGALVCSFDNSAAIAGAGKGTGKSVNSVEELSNVMDWISEGGFAADYSTARLASSNDWDDWDDWEDWGDDSSSSSDSSSDWDDIWGDDILDNDDNKPKSKYTSVTLEFKTTSGAITSQYMSGVGSIDQRVTMDRAMTCYFTEKAAYYDIEATIRQQYSSDDSSSNTSMYIKAQFYMDKKHFLMRFEDLAISQRATVDGELQESDDEMPDFEPIFYKWVDFTTVGGGELLEIMSYVTEENFEDMSTFGDYMAKREEDSKVFSKSGDTYTLKKAEAKELCVDLVDGVPEEAVDEVSFVVDLAMKKAPRITFEASLDYSSDGNSSYSMSYKGADRIVCTIKNINNTVVSFPKGKIYDAEDFEELFE